MTLPGYHKFLHLRQPAEISLALSKPLWEDDTILFVHELAVSSLDRAVVDASLLRDVLKCPRITQQVASCEDVVCV